MIVNVNSNTPINKADANTCCHLNAWEVLFEKAHIEKAGDDCIPISANMYVIHIIPVHDPPTESEP